HEQGQAADRHPGPEEVREEPRAQEMAEVEDRPEQAQENAGRTGHERRALPPVHPRWHREGAVAHGVAVPFSSSARSSAGTSARGVPPLPENSRLSSWSCPRPTVPATCGRAERSSPKNVLFRKGRYFGWSCMSRRHAINRNIARRTQSRFIVRLPRRPSVPD